MKLADFDPHFVKILSNGHYQMVDSLADAQGIHFLCPKCFSKNNGPVGTHLVLVWFKDRGVPENELPLPGRWTVTGGADMSDLTLTASIQLPNGAGQCGWHGFVTNGEIVNA